MTGNEWYMIFALWFNISMFLTYIWWSDKEKKRWADIQQGFYDDMYKSATEALMGWSALQQAVTTEADVKTRAAIDVEAVRLLNDALTEANSS